jgi:hypothetical protein
MNWEPTIKSHIQSANRNGRLGIQRAARVPILLALTMAGCANAYLLRKLARIESSSDRRYCEHLSRVAIGHAASVDS